MQSSFDFTSNAVHKMQTMPATDCLDQSISPPSESGIDMNENLLKGSAY